MQVVGRQVVCRSNAPCSNLDGLGFYYIFYKDMSVYIRIYTRVSALLYRIYRSPIVHLICRENYTAKSHNILTCTIYIDNTYRQTHIYIHTYTRMHACICVCTSDRHRQLLHKNILLRATCMTSFGFFNHDVEDTSAFLCKNRPREKHQNKAMETPADGQKKQPNKNRKKARRRYVSVRTRTGRSASLIGDQRSRLIIIIIIKVRDS